jgi:hypothetical protein
MLSRAFDVLVHVMSGIPVVALVVIATLGWMIDAAEARTSNPRTRRTRDILLS